MRLTLLAAVLFFATSAEALTTKQIVYAGFDTFAVLQDDGSVQVHEGNFSKGEFAIVAHQLKSGVVSLAANRAMGFAAVKDDGTVVTWGGRDTDASSIQSQLQGIVKVVGNERSFAALRSDGAIVTWGWSGTGGDFSTRASDLFSGKSADGRFKDVIAIGYTFYGTLESGKLVRFGWSSGLFSGKQPDIKNIKKAVQVDVGARAVLGADGTLYQDGWINSWDRSERPRNDLTTLIDVQDVVATNRAFAVLKTDGSVYSWGLKSDNDAFAEIAPLLKSGVVSIVSSRAGGFAALKADGSVICWNNRSSYTAVAKGAVKVFANMGAFVALMDDGTVKSWGDSKSGATMGLDAEFALRFGKVVDIWATNDSFIALKSNGQAVAWGGYGGGSPTREQRKLLASDVISIDVADTFLGNFIVRKKDGTIVVLGSNFGAIQQLLR